MTLRTRSHRDQAPSRHAAGAAVLALGRLAMAVLLVFHVWLLSVHIATGKLLEADVAVRWVLAVAVFAAFAALRRFGLSVFRDKRAAALWLLVILIHCHAAWTSDAGTITLAVPQAVIDLVPAGAQVAAAIAFCLMLAWLAPLLAVGHSAPSLVDAPTRFAGLPAAVGALRFSPRPPPIA